MAVEPESVERGVLRLMLLTLGFGLVFVGIMLLSVGSMGGAPEEGFVIIGPFFFAYGRSAGPEIVVAMVAASLFMLGMTWWVLRRVESIVEGA